MAEAIGALRWYLEIDGITEAIFREVSGLDSENEVIEHRETGNKGNLVVKKFPGALKWSNITLKRGITDNKKLHDWRVQVEQGKIQEARKNGSITCYAPDNTPIVKYTFKNAWPCKWTGPSLNASGNELAVEEITLAHEGLERQQ